VSGVAPPVQVRPVVPLHETDPSTVHIGVVVVVVLPPIVQQYSVPLAPAVPELQLSAGLPVVGASLPVQVKPKPSLHETIESCEQVVPELKAAQQNAVPLPPGTPSLQMRDLSVSSGRSIPEHETPKDEAVQPVTLSSAAQLLPTALSWIQQ
jgi:hypothetical protein